MLYYQFAEETMDVNYKLLKRIAPVVALFMLTAALASAQVTLTVSSNSVAISGNQAQNISVNASNSGAVSYTATGYAAWLRVTSGNNFTTPDTLYFQLASECGTTCSTSVTLTPAGGGASTAVTVTYSNSGGGGGGNGSLTASPASLTMSALQNQVTSQVVTISTTSPTAINITGVATNVSWLTVSLNTFTISSSSPASMTVTANATGLSNITYSTNIVITPSVGTQVTIPVSFTVGSNGGGGGGSSASYTVTPVSFTLIPNASAGGNCSQYSGTSSSCYVQVSANNNTVSVYNAFSTSTSGVLSPLLLNGSSTLFNAGVGLLTVSLNAGLVPTVAGTYTFNVVVQNPNNAADSVTLTVSLIVGGGGGNGYTVTPGSLSFTANGTPPASQTLTVSIPSGTQYSASISYIGNGSVSQNWMTLNGSTNLVGLPAGNIAVAVNPTGLPIGTYSAYINVQTQNYSVNNGLIQVPVTLSVTSSTGGGGNTTIAAPSSLAFAYQSGTGTPYQQYITIAPSGQYSVSVSTSNGQGWLNASQSSGIGPGIIAISTNPGGLSPGTYNGTVSITTPSGSQTVNVTLQVTANTVLLVNAPGTLNISTTASSGTQSPAFQILASDGTAVGVTLTSNTSWITIPGGTSVTTPSTVTIQINPSTLCNGINSGTITATGTAANSPVTIPVTVLISGASSNCSGGGGSGPLTLTPTSLPFSAAVGSGLLQQTLAISSSTSTFTTVTYSSTGNWLSIASIVSGQSIAVPQTLVVYASPGSLPQNTYSGTITFTTNGQAQSVPVTLFLGTSGGGTITVSPTAVSFAPAAGTTTPSTQNISVNGTTAANVTVTYNGATTNSGGSWLSAQTTGGVTLTAGQTITTPTNIIIVASPTGLAAGTYNGSVLLTPIGGAQVSIPVTFTIASQATVSATPTSLTFSYQAGGTAPSAQSVQVTGSGSAALTFSATASSTGTWLSVSPAAGTTPATLSVSVNPSSLTAGTYNGTVVVAGTGSATGSTTINVTLTVTAPLPTITSIGNAASYAGGSISPGEIITIFGTALGPNPPVQSPTVDPTTGLVSTTLGNVQVLVGGIAAPMLYVSATQVSAVVPYEIARQAFGTSILVKFLGQTSNAISVNVSPSVPGIFSQNASGTGPAAVLNQDFSGNGPNNPAARGSTISIYLTGEGQTSPAGVTGSVTCSSHNPCSSVSQIPVPLLPVAVRIDNQPAAITFAGNAPTFVAGLMQLNAVIPTTVPDTGAVPLQVTIGSVNSQTGITVFVK
jgi:uncharacterized protein (TIGR03437 family)